MKFAQVTDITELKTLVSCTNIWHSIAFFIPYFKMKELLNCYNGYNFKNLLTPSADKDMEQSDISCLAGRDVNSTDDLEK